MVAAAAALAAQAAEATAAADAPDEESVPRAAERPDGVISIFNKN